MTFAKPVNPFYAARQARRAVLSHDGEYQSAISRVSAYANLPQALRPS